MSQHSAAPRPRASAPGGVSRGRVAALAAVIVVVLAGARGAFPSVSVAGPWRSHVLLVGAALEIALAVLLIALVRRAGRAAPDGQPAAQLRSWLRRALVVFLIVIPIVMAAAFSVGLQHHLPALKQVRRHPAPRPRRVPHIAVSLPGHPGLAILYGLLALALLALITACVVAVWRRRGSGAVPQAGYQHPDEPQQVLGRAVEAGRSALRRLDDARAAIIACYVAMERSLGTAGAARDAADTPDELLARAAQAGLVHGRAAGDLTGLFCEARFSSHALPPERKAAAEQALAALEAELRTRPAAEQVEADQLKADQLKADQLKAGQLNADQLKAGQLNAGAPD